ncbi:MAG: acyltransferase family protein, partial [Micromonosporaceae bacterium]
MTTRRDRYLDALRGGSLLVVVLWHWGLTMLVWRADGPHATNPLAYTPGLWIFTWVLQVMPLFFFVGGAVHLASWRAARQRGERLGDFVRRRIGRLAVPGMALVLVWTVVATGLATRFGAAPALSAAKLVLSPLWFLAVYLLLVALLPVALWLHDRLGVRALLLLTGLAAATDLVRVGLELKHAGWLNLIFVWGLAHQAGLHWEQLITAPRQLAVWCVAGGVAALTALVTLADYPGSMVGVPGDRWSNMAPPTLAIVGLLAVQAGLVALLRPAAQRLLARAGWRAGVGVLSRYALGLFLLHT